MTTSNTLGYLDGYSLTQGLPTGFGLDLMPKEAVSYSGTDAVHQTNRSPELRELMNSVVGNDSTRQAKFYDYAGADVRKQLENDFIHGVTADDTKRNIAMTVGGSGVGAALGGLFGGAQGAAFGGVLGALVGYVAQAFGIVPEEAWKWVADQRSKGALKSTLSRVAGQQLVNNGNLPEEIETILSAPGLGDSGIVYTMAAERVARMEADGIPDAAAYSEAKRAEEDATKNVYADAASTDAAGDARNLAITGAQQGNYMSPAETQGAEDALAGYRNDMNDAFRRTRMYDKNDPRKANAEHEYNQARNSFNSEFDARKRGVGTVGLTREHGDIFPSFQEYGTQIPIQQAVKGAKTPQDIVDIIQQYRNRQAKTNLSRRGSAEVPGIWDRVRDGFMSAGRTEIGDFADPNVSPFNNRFAGYTPGMTPGDLLPYVEEDWAKEILGIELNTPAVPAPNPAVPAPKPAASAPKTTAPSPALKPAAPAPKPAASAPKTTAPSPALKPAAPAPKPTAPAPKPTASVNTSSYPERRNIFSSYNNLRQVEASGSTQHPVLDAMWWEVLQKTAEAPVQPQVQAPVPQEPSPNEVFKHQAKMQEMQAQKQLIETKSSAEQAKAQATARVSQAAAAQQYTEAQQTTGAQQAPGAQPVAQEQPQSQPEAQPQQPATMPQAQWGQPAA